MQNKLENILHLHIIIKKKEREKPACAKTQCILKGRWMMVVS